MDKNISYCIIKNYKGIFSKTHTGNTQLFLIPLVNTFIGLIILGELADEENVWAGQVFVTGPLEYLKELMDFILEDEDAEIVESLSRKLKVIDNEWSYEISFPKKGKYLNNFSITFSPEYSSGTIRVFLIEGNLSFLFDETINKSSIKMVSMVKHAKLKSLLSAKSLNIK